MHAEKCPAESQATKLLDSILHCIQLSNKDRLKNLFLNNEFLYSIEDCLKLGYNIYVVNVHCTGL